MRHTRERKVLLLFFDGIGLGRKPSPSNPFQFLPSKFFHFTRRKVFREFRGQGKSIDATLGVPGLPQSATGQATILTGVNAAKYLGYHLNGMPNAALRELIHRESIFVKLRRLNLPITFANAYQPRFFQGLSRWISVSTASVLAAGLPLRTIEDVRKERAVYQEFTNAYLASKRFRVRAQSPEEAGRVLARLAHPYAFCFYEYFLSDLAGHMRNFDRALIEAYKLDRFIESVLRHTDLKQQTVLVVSDHGNLEDPTTPSHTRNPVPLLAFGRETNVFARQIQTLTDIAPTIVSYLRASQRS